MFTLYWLRIETSNALENQSILSFTKLHSNGYFLKRSALNPLLSKGNSKAKFTWLNDGAVYIFNEYLILTQK